MINGKNNLIVTEANLQQGVEKPWDGGNKPDRQERRWVAVFALGVMAITLLPYMIGYIVQGADWRFTGFMIGVEDGNSYIAKMLTSSEGAWLFRTPYTAYPQRGVLLFIPYFLLGKLAAPPELHDQLVALYHIFRMVSGYLVILATYDFIAFFIRKVSLRRLGLALSVLGGGLGWLLLLAGRDSWLGSLPLEFYSPESFGFLGLFGIPHLTIARAFMLWGLLAYIRTAELDLDARSALKPGLKIGLLWLLTGLIQPLIGMVVGAVVIIYLITIFLWQLWLGLNQSTHARWTEWRKRLYLAFWAGLVALPWVAYNFVSLYQDPFLRVWTAQSRIPSPHPVHYLLAYGLMLFPAVIGGNYLTNKSSWSGWLPVGWVLALPILAYAPYSLQRRLPDGIWVALVVLAMAGLEQIDLRQEKRSLTQWLKLPMFLAFPSTLILFLGAFLTVLNPARPIFRPAAEVAAFIWLADASQTSQVVLTAYETGNALPAWAPVRVLIGHGPESFNLAELKPRVTQFFQVDTSETTRQELLDEFKVSFVFWGPAERSLGDWNPIQASYLELQYQSDDYAIFSVREN
jgi:hypothetical protein